ncbi:hypothetical protein K7432_007252 [Basidiobolus ranarum]|uniref:Uncharacterized protein n=1 Tax=Basidiobolus ranarum TaxID=34480 RepID=A0ABR2WTR4_9FUNG
MNSIWCTLQKFLIIACLVNCAVSFSPQNSLKMFVTYELAWLNAKSGQFGANMTISLPQESTSNWKLKIKYQQPTTKIALYWDGDPNTGDTWNTMSDKSDSYIVEPKKSNRLVRSYLFNALFPVSDEELATDIVKAYTLPASYIVILDDGSSITLNVEDDFKAMWSTVPTKRFGPYDRAYPPGVSASPSGPTPDGTTIVGTPIGLYMYGAVFLIGAMAYFFGTFQRSRFRSQFRYQMNLRDEIKMVPMSN